ncbi:PhzF family phenazine biosynthesis protein [Streptomyces sp. AJS327]|uniref:PhzF family phenazine biosynthesis protein n=1 Tax=Streptomyces sp. AJS327 TaxID=2545265 RepID=UPI0015DDFF69|nr:PhzF family phenazine biosynthesis protein [Streptomyces sp. AJS327]MBA0050227.1 PhzF family phenazine biosynthesis protein [Streptomyces sp. AJS327]
MRLYIVDAFTDRPFLGNPAGVCPLPGPTWPDEHWMQQVAAEVNHSETAFALPVAGGGATDWEIRWFTPRVETNLCGHATLATSHILRTEHGLAGTLHFASRYSGPLHAQLLPDGEITLDFPAAPGEEAPVPDGLAEALGVQPESVHRTGALGDLLTVLPDEAAVRRLDPDLSALAEVIRNAGLRGVIATARATEGAVYDVVSRFFSPAEGIPEDPVTGSAHTAVAPYWSALLGRKELTAFQASPRTGVIRTAVRGDRVDLTGRAVTVWSGTLHNEPTYSAG